MHSFEYLKPLCKCNIDEIETIGIYTITSKSTGKVYVGSATRNVSPRYKGFKDRWLIHFAHLLKNKHSNRKLQNHVNKYGIEDLEFDILENCEKDLAIGLELYWTNQLNSVNEGFNLYYPGTWTKRTKRNEKYQVLSSLQLNKLQESTIGKKPKRHLNMKDLRKNANDLYEDFWNGVLDINDLREKYNIKQNACIIKMFSNIKSK